AGHQAEADLEPPDPAGDADVDEVDALLLRGRVAADRVPEVRVAAVDDDVARLDDLEQLLERLLGDLAGWDHHPEDARRLELREELVERLGRRLDVRVVGHDLVPAVAESLRHPAAHAAQADHAELHRSSSLTRATRRPRSLSDA